MTQFVAWAHNDWLRLPAGVRSALSFSVAVLVASAIGLIQAFGWFVPASTADAKGEAIAFLTYAVPVLAVLVAQLVRSKVAPALVAWFLGTFGYAPASKVQRAASPAGLRRGDIWVRC
jgi:Na+/melibiose symporter-like transporter